MNNLFHRNCFPFRVACRNLIKALCKVKGCTCMTFLQYIQQTFFCAFIWQSLNKFLGLVFALKSLSYNKYVQDVPSFHKTFVSYYLKIQSSFNKNLNFWNISNASYIFQTIYNYLTVEVGFGTPGTKTQFKAAKYLVFNVKINSRFRITYTIFKPEYFNGLTETNVS